MSVGLVSVGVGAALAMMLVASRVLNPLNWLGLLLGCFVTLKVQWVVMAWPYAKIRGFTKP